MSGILKIKIKRGYSDGRLKLRYKLLDLYDATNAEAERRDFVRWINVADEVKSIEKIEPKPNSDNIFSVPPHRQDDNLWTAEISSGTPDYSKYIYSIWWKDIDGNPKQYDPKITIKPSAGIFFTLERVAIGAAAVAGLSLLILLGSKKWHK